jgi:hypothetical protein
MLLVEESLVAIYLNPTDPPLRTPTIFSMMYLARKTAEARRSRFGVLAHIVVVYGCLVSTACNSLHPYQYLAPSERSVVPLSGGCGLRSRVVLAFGRLIVSRPRLPPRIPRDLRFLG